MRPSDDGTSAPLQGRHSVRGHPVYQEGVSHQRLSSVQPGQALLATPACSPGESKDFYLCMSEANGGNKDGGQMAEPVGDRTL